MKYLTAFILLMTFTVTSFAQGIINLGNGLRLARGFNIAEISQLVETSVTTNQQGVEVSVTKLVGQVHNVSGYRPDGSTRLVWPRRRGDNNIEVNYFVTCNSRIVYSTSYNFNCSGSVYINLAGTLDLDDVNQDIDDAINRISFGSFLIDLEGVLDFGANAQSVVGFAGTGGETTMHGWYEAENGRGFLDQDKLVGPNGDTVDIAWSLHLEGLSRSRLFGTGLASAFAFQP